VIAIAHHEARTHLPSRTSHRTSDGCGAAVSVQIWSSAINPSTHVPSVGPGPVQ
jgi:hypothetical protein